MLNIDRKMKREIIELNVENIKSVVNKSYMNNSFAIQVNTEKDVPEFEKLFAKNLSKTINKYLEVNKIDPSKVNRSITYSVTNKQNNIVINF